MVRLAGPHRRGVNEVQVTRERILSILKEENEATVSDLSEKLGLTAVTVRHHLDILRGEGLVAAPMVHRRRAPGRPQHVYTLTETASEHFPKLYDRLARCLLDDLHDHLSEGQVEAMMERIGERMAEDFGLRNGRPFEQMLADVVGFLNARGYLASWEALPEGNFLLHVANCPYERVATSHPEVCLVDSTFLRRALGTEPRRIASLVEDGRQCTYTLQAPADHSAAGPEGRT